MEQVLIDMLNNQMAIEFKNFRLYKNFAGISDYISLTGACKYFNKQSQHEYSHFEKLYSFLSDRGYIPELKYQDTLPNDKMTLEEIFTQVVTIESDTTESLQKLYDLAIMFKDGQTIEIALEMLKEQVEEEKTAYDLSNRCKLSKNNLLIFDCELGNI